MPDPIANDEPSILSVRGLPARLDDDAHARYLQIALAAVEAGRGDLSRFPPAPKTPQ